MTFARSRLGYVLAGEPLYAWTTQAGSAPRVDTASALLGVFVSRSGHTLPLPKPPVDGTITAVRMVGDGDGFAAVFAQTERRSGQEDDPKVNGYWFGRTDGRAWTSLERLPVPLSGTMHIARASVLVRSGTGATLTFALLFEAGGRHDVGVYTRGPAGWRMDTLLTRNAAYVALAAQGDAAFLYVVRPDTAMRQDANSLSLFVRTSSVSAWRDQGFLIHGGRQPVHHPAVLAHGGSRTLSWLQHDDIARTWNARAARLRADGTLGPAVSFGGAMDVFPVHDTAHPPRWVVSAIQSGGQPTLALVEWGDADPIIRDIAVDPFTGPALAHSTDVGNVVVVGPLMGRSPREEPVVSSVLSFVARCRSSAIGDTPEPLFSAQSERPLNPLSRGAP